VRLLRADLGSVKKVVAGDALRIAALKRRQTNCAELHRKLQLVNEVKELQVGQLPTATRAKRPRTRTHRLALAAAKHPRAAVQRRLLRGARADQRGAEGAQDRPRRRALRAQHWAGTRRTAVRAVLGGATGAGAALAQCGTLAPGSTVRHCRRS
jgi:hypothetical protein